MERGFHFGGKPPEFDGTNYPYWKIKMQAHLMGIDSRVWEIIENTNYVVLAARVGQEQIDQHNANSRARSVLFSSLKDTEFERVLDCATAREIWVRLQNYHEGTLPYDDHERAIKLLYALDRKVWDVKVNAILESPALDTLIVDELFSKLKSSEIDNQIQAKLKNPTASSLALVSGK